MADGILARDDRAVGQAGGDMVGKITDHSRKNCGARFVDPADESK